MAITKKFHKDLLRELLYIDEGKTFQLSDEDDSNWGNPGDKFWPVHSERLDDSRWSANYYRVFGFQAAGTQESKFYQTFYSAGLTESQDERPYEWEDTFVSCEEVERFVRIITKEVVEWKVKE